MTATILALETEVPKTLLAQEDFAKAATKHLKLSEPQTRLLERITKNSQINYRHTVVEDFHENGLKGAPFNFCENTPQTALRNEIFKKHAPQLAISVCEKALNEWGGDRQSITHVISVSCTGMIAPGIEFLLIDALGLSRHVERLGINFMGCFGAFKGLAVAKALAIENPRHRILLVCTELCSLHFQADTQIDTLVSNSLFADGTAAVILGAQPHSTERPLFEIQRQGSTALEQSLDLMSWEAGDYGYNMRLSALVPAQIEAHIAPFVSRLIGAEQSFQSFTWAVHPGGRSIVESVARACELQPEQLKASWKVLKEYGNMSSPTFLFVLKEILNDAPRSRSNRLSYSCTLPKSNQDVIGLGFGPGLSVEGILLKRMDT
jgi:predicted naringenin-chalcone synthase